MHFNSQNSDSLSFSMYCDKDLKTLGEIILRTSPTMYWPRPGHLSREEARWDEQSDDARINKSTAIENKTVTSAQLEHGQTS